jgi:choline kinase
MEESKGYKVFIPCAGIGSRLGLKYNKTLTTVGHTPVISHIIGKFPSNIEIVIALGYKGDHVRQIVDLLYPDRKITYVDIDPYKGKGSGLGFTILSCQEELQCPFVFCSCDTIVTDPIPEPTSNWMGYANITEGLEQYRTIKLSGDNTIRMGGPSYPFVKEICSKNAQGDYPYIGLAGIHDYEIFWKRMNEGKDLGSIEMGEVFGLKYLIDSPVRAIKFQWFDTGNPDSLEKTRQHLWVYGDDIHILPKDDEAIWFTNINGSPKKVVKFSVDEGFIAGRVERAGDLEGHVPPIELSGDNYYTYDMVPGDVLSNKLNAANFQLFLDYLKVFWKPTSPIVQVAKFHERCTQFYKDKTTKRVKQYFKTFEQIDQPEIINGVTIPGIWDVLDKIDWDWICDGVPSNIFHGDLHFENIIINDGKFTLLDWRQDFGGLNHYGDIYYDLAKLNHGILISHELIEKDLFSHSISNDVVTFDFLRKNISVEIEQMFKEFVIEQGYDYRKVQFLTYLIFLNIAALHHYPYGLLLFHLGKSGLWNLLEQK